MTMALSTKNSRPISVLGVDYRWAVFFNSGWIDLTIQAACGSGQKLITQFGIDVVITPHVVAEVIKSALAEGWKPNQREKPLHGRYSEARFSKR